MNYRKLQLHRRKKLNLYRQKKERIKLLENRHWSSGIKGREA
jgi:hypothetical protein